MVKKFTLLSRNYCTLCENMLKEILKFQIKYNFDLEVIDIDKHIDLVYKYDELVPVLLVDNKQELFHWHFDEEVFIDFLTNNNNEQ